MFKSREFINLEINRGDWCGYKGECLIDSVMVGDLCALCNYRIPLPIPQMLKEEKERKDMERERSIFEMIDRPIKEKDDELQD